MTQAPAKSPSELESLLYSGDYENVIAATAAAEDPRTLPALIGALALLGRLDEAESAYRRLVASAAGTPSSLIVARFFVIAGLCHAGQVGRALRRARATIADRVAADAASRYWVWQGMALVRFFEGRFARARRLARRALSAAVEAAFPYARLLALDLLAHVLVETGEIHAGMRVLAQAESLADALGYEANRLTLHTSAAVFQLRFLLLPIDAAIAQARLALDNPAVSYFTRRNGLLELAIACALAGRAQHARVALDDARQIALPGSDRRGKTRSSIAHAIVSALSDGRDAARTSIDEAWSTAEEQLTLAAEVGFADVFFVGPSAKTESALPAVARASGVTRAQLAASVVRGDPLPSTTRLEDRLCRVMVACQSASPSARLGRVLQEDLHGLVAWALDLPAGRRIIVSGDRIISDNQGEVVIKASPGGPSVRLLSALRRGYQGRDTLVSSVWGLGRYDPMRHGGVINTAVSRLRLALAEPSWIVTHDDGYELQSGVEVVELSAPATPEPLASATPPLEEHDRVVSFLERNGAATTTDVARALGVSSSSALRLLRRLEHDRRVARVGRGRATRYQLCDPLRDDG